MNKVTYQGMEFDEEELKEIRKENQNSYSLINPMEFSRMVNPIRLNEEELNKPYKAIITDIPGYGKTTAIFHYMSQRLKLIGTYHAVYSASRIEDVYHMFLKFVAEFGDKYKLSLFTSDKKFNNVKELTELYYSRIIFLCHERLFVEPFSLLYRVEYNPLEKAMYSFSISPNRDDIFIDEIPSNLYKCISLNQKISLETLNYLAYGKRKEFLEFMNEKGFNPNEEELRLMKETARSNFVKSIIESRMDVRQGKKDLHLSPSNEDSNKIIGENQSLMLSAKVIDNAPTTIANSSKSITRDIAGIGLNNEKGFFLLSKLTYFINLFASKYEENPLEDFIFYSPDDFECKKLIFFSGTGDLLARKSTKYKIINSRGEDKAYRFLDLYEDTTLVSPRLMRKSSAKLIAEEYSEILIKILEDNPEEIVLVYTWKDSKSNQVETEELFYDIDENLSEIPTKILQFIPEEFQSRIKFITYQSGKEQSTNEYLDCGVIVILGEFFVPQYVISCRNKIFGSESTEIDYTMHLMIQAIYRTRARKHFDSDKTILINGNKIKANSIKLYIDDRYGLTFIQSLLSKFKLINCDSINSVKIRPKNIYISEFKIPEELIQEKFFTGNDYSDYIIINSKNLSSVISTMKTLNSVKLKKILDNKNISYEIINPNSKGRNNYTLYKIYPYRILCKIEK